MVMETIENMDIKKESKPEQEYPDYFPEGCPPDDASIETKKLYRFCRGNKPEKGDFVSYYQMNPEKYKEIIIAYGLSVLQTAEDCLRAYRKFPFIRKYCTVASGITNAERGSWKNTPGRISPDHITWWMCKNVEPLEFFEFGFKLGD